MLTSVPEMGVTRYHPELSNMLRKTRMCLLKRLRIAFVESWRDTFRYDRISVTNPLSMKVKHP